MYRCKNEQKRMIFGYLKLHYKNDNFEIFRDFCKFRVHLILQTPCNGTIGPLITYRNNKYSGVVGPSSDMTSKRINNTTSYIKLKSTDGSIFLGRLNHLQGFPEDHPHVEKETLLNPSHIRAAGHYVSDSEIKNDKILN